MRNESAYLALGLKNSVEKERGGGADRKATTLSDTTIAQISGHIVGQNLTFRYRNVCDGHN